MRLSAHVLGPVTMSSDEAAIDVGGPRQRRLLAALLVHRRSTASTDQLVEAIFGGDPPDAAWRTLRTYVARLRRAFDAAGIDGSSVVVTSPPGYALAPEVQVDADRFDELLAEARDLLGDGEPQRALASIDEALEQWSGPAYGEFSGENWARPDAVRLEELRFVGRELRCAALVESGRSDEAIAELQALVEADSLRTEPRRLLMLALYRSGRHAEALRSGRSFRSLLADETGLDWSKSLAELERLIIDRDPRLDAVPAGRRLRGYVLGDVLADTPHGVAYRASQPAVGRDVAITVIPAELADDVEFIRSFERHAQRIASIEHPHVVPLYDYWREPGGAYLVTRFMAGGSLSQRLDEGGDIAVEDAERIIEEIGEALDGARARGVFHGRLTSDCVLFDEMQRSYLAGFSVDSVDASYGSDLVGFAEVAAAVWERALAGVGGRNGRPTEMLESVVTAARNDGAAIFPSNAALARALIAAGRGEPSGEGSSEPITTSIEGPNPFRGLQAFAESDADVFFGRQAMVAQLASDLRRDSFVALVGPSGSGKSSTARAGLLPMLRDSGALVATMVPGAHPVSELEIALSRVAATAVPDCASLLERPDGLSGVVREMLPAGHTTLVLLIDQLEEALTMSDATERDLVFDAIARTVRDADTRLQVVVTARADFLGRILEHPVIGPLIRDHSRLITPLDSEELYEAIVEPAASAGVGVEPELATALVADAIESAGSLPLLQFALTELYERRVEGTMTLDAYRRMGGLAAPVAQRAEEIFSSLSPGDQAATRRLFTRLIHLGDGAEDTRRRVLRSELATVPDSVLGVFGRARLLSFDRDPRTREPTVEVAHEALIRRWPQLRSWVDDDRASQLVLRHLTTAAATWNERGGDPAELYRGSRLASVDDWSEDHEEELTPLEKEFLASSRMARDANLAREHRRSRRLRLLASGLAVVALLAVIAGVVAELQRDRAESNASEADAQRRVAEEQEAVAEANADAAESSAEEAERQAINADVERLTAESSAAMGEDPNVPILLALQAYQRSLELDDTPPAPVMATMQTAVQSSRLLFESTDVGDVGAISPDGTMVVSALIDEPGTLVVIDGDSGEEFRRFETGHDLADVAFDGTGNQLALVLHTTPTGDSETGSKGMEAWILDTSTWQVTGEYEVDERFAAPCCVGHAEFSPDGRRLAVFRVNEEAFEEFTVYAWDLERPARSATRHTNSEGFAGWMADSRSIAVIGAGGGPIQSIDALTGETAGEIMDIAGVYSADINPAGDELIVIRDVIEIWSLGSGEQLDSMELLNPTVGTRAEFSPDGASVVELGADDEVRVTTLDSGAQLSLAGNPGGVWVASISDDGEKLFAVGSRGGRLWDLLPAGPAELGNLASSGVIDGLRFTADESQAVVVEGSAGGDSQRVRMFDLSSGDVVAESRDGLPGDASVVMSDGGLLAIGGNGEDRPAHVERQADGEIVATFGACDDTGQIDDQGRWLLLGFVDGPCAPTSSRVVDPVTGDVLTEFDERVLLNARFGPSGTAAEGLLVAGSFHRSVGDAGWSLAVHRLPGGELVGSLPEAGRDFWIPFFSSDGRYITFGSGGTGGYVISVERLLGGASMEDSIVLNEMGVGGVITFPDAGGGWFVGGESGEVLHFWDLETGDEQMTLPVDTGRSTLFKITADGRNLYYSAAGGVIRRFPLDHADLAALARDRVQRDFTEAECERFIIADDCTVYADPA